MRRKIIFNSFVIIFVLAGVFFGFLSFFGMDIGVIKTSAQISNEEKIDFDGSVLVDFSHKMISKNPESNLEITPEIKADYVWKNNNKQLEIIPKDNWQLGKDYQVKIKGMKNIFLVDNEMAVNFSTASYPRVTSFYPKDKSEQVIIDIESPGKVRFDKPLGDFNLKIKVSPSKKLSYNINEDKDVVSFVFEGGYEKGEKYDIALYIKHKKEKKDAYQEVYRSSFKTEAPSPQEWDKDHKLRVIQAKKYTKAIVKEGKYIDIDLSVQIMTIFENGEALDSFLISSGKRGMDTPRGNFNIQNKHPRPWSNQYGLYMPYWMAIVPSGKYGIHELPEWPSGYKEGENHLGTPVSHGCVRLGVGAAERVYNWAEIGTPVIIH